MTTEPNESDELLRRAAADDPQALADLFAHCRERLWRMVHLRLDRRLQGRLDPEDVLQEAFIVLTKRFQEYALNPTMPFFLWLRQLTGQKLIDLHRQHLGARMRDASQEVSLHRGALPQASSASLAAQLLGRLTSASQAAIRAETQLRVQDAINSMDPVDREVLTLRNFEMLNNEETAAVLGIKRSAASKRHILALKRLKKILDGFPGLADNLPD
jgi:RNA polymerase sigma-70 factor (ECF subfamily)